MKVRFLIDGQSDLFGPGTDLIISLLGVLLMAVTVNNVKDKDFENMVKDHQLELIDSIAGSFGKTKVLLSYNAETESEKYLIPIKGDTINDIIIENYATLQKITFGGSILFAPDSIILKNEGQVMISIVGKEIKGRLNQISEIQIHGHADTMPSKLHRSNIVLAFERANSVFQHLTKKINIDPDKEKMSIVSYGDSSPINRNGEWSRRLTIKNNETIQQRARNRRIELLLNYTWK